MPKQIAIVPAKAHSSRVPNKNFREFSSGLSLVDLKLSQLKASEAFDEIWLSTDHEEGKAIADKYGCSFVEREPRLTKFETPWSDTLAGIIESVPHATEDDFISICFATAPFFSSFDSVLSSLDVKQFDSVLTVTPFRHHLISSSGLPLNFQYGPWHGYSQELQHHSVMNNAMFHAPRSVMMRYRYQFGIRPLHFETSILAGWDIDTTEEFELAQLWFEKMASGSP